MPAYWPGGVRHKGGASLVWALAWNVGTCRLAPAWRPVEQFWPAAVCGRDGPKRQIRKGLVLMRGTGADCPVVVLSVAARPRSGPTSGGLRRARSRPVCLIPSERESAPTMTIAVQRPATIASGRERLTVGR